MRLGLVEAYVLLPSASPCFRQQAQTAFRMPVTWGSPASGSQNSSWEQAEHEPRFRSGVLCPGIVADVHISWASFGGGTDSQKETAGLVTTSGWKLPDEVSASVNLEISGDGFYGGVY